MHKEVEGQSHYFRPKANDPNGSHAQRGLQAPPVYETLEQLLFLISRFAFFQIFFAKFASAGTFDMNTLQYKTSFTSIVFALSIGISIVFAQDSLQESRPLPQRDVIKNEAVAVRPLVSSPVAKAFLDSAKFLEPISDRTIYWNRETGQAMTASQFSASDEATVAGFEKLVIDEKFYYTTRYGSPIPSVRVYDLAAAHGLETFEGQRLCDFGFDSIGSLRMAASLGADVVGTEVFDLLQSAYSDPSDTGEIPACGVEGVTRNGTLTVAFGRWPGDASTDEAVARVAGDGLNLFLSKNTLKRGYIHPTRKFGTREIGEGMIELGVDDHEFLSAVMEALAHGGLFVIYNLGPKYIDNEEGYVPWSDIRCPFERATMTKVGFEVLAFDVDDSRIAREIGKALNWDENGMDVDGNLFAKYTIVRRPNQKQ